MTSGIVDPSPATNEQASFIYTEVLVEGAGELVERRGHLEVLLEDAALALDPHALGPPLFSLSFLLQFEKSSVPRWGV